MNEPARQQKNRAFEAEALRWLPDVTRFALSLTSVRPETAVLYQREPFCALENG